MKISDIYHQKKGKHIVSYEVFPPKNKDDINKLYQTIEELKEINPDYVSVTYGAGGSNQEKTIEIASTIQNELETNVMAHLTCVNATIDDTCRVLKRFEEKNIENIFALRGDPPQGQMNFTKTIGGFGYASELIKYIAQNNYFCIGAAGYPEKHPEAVSMEKDVENLKRKVDNGAAFIITQLFFDNEYFYRYRDLCAKKNIKIKIEPGIMPILNFTSMQRMISMCGTKLPQKLSELLIKNQNDKKAIEKIGIDYAINQISDLLDQEVDGIHFYAMNKSKEIKLIYNSLLNKIKR